MAAGLSWTGCNSVDIRGNSYEMCQHTEFAKTICPTAARAISNEWAQQEKDG